MGPNTRPADPNTRPAGPNSRPVGPNTEGNYGKQIIFFSRYGSKDLRLFSKYEEILPG